MEKINLNCFVIIKNGRFVNRFNIDLTAVILDQCSYISDSMDIEMERIVEVFGNELFSKGKARFNDDFYEVRLIGEIEVKEDELDLFFTEDEIDLAHCQNASDDVDEGYEIIKKQVNDNPIYVFLRKDMYSFLEFHGAVYNDFDGAVKGVCTDVMEYFKFELGSNGGAFMDKLTNDWNTYGVASSDDFNTVDYYIIKINTLYNIYSDEKDLPHPIK